MSDPAWTLWTLGVALGVYALGAGVYLTYRILRKDRR